MPPWAGAHHSKLHLSKSSTAGLVKDFILFKWGTLVLHILSRLGFEKNHKTESSSTPRTVRNPFPRSLMKYSPSSLTCSLLKCCLVLLLLRVFLRDPLDATYLGCSVSYLILMHSSFWKPTTPEKICSNTTLAKNNNPMLMYYCSSTKLLHFCLLSCTLLLSTALSAGALVHSSRLHHFAELHQGKHCTRANSAPGCTRQLPAGHCWGGDRPPCLPSLNWDTPNHCQPEQDCSVP